MKRLQFLCMVRPHHQDRRHYQTISHTAYYIKIRRSGARDFVVRGSCGAEESRLSQAAGTKPSPPVGTTGAPWRTKHQAPCTRHPAPGTNHPPVAAPTKSSTGFRPKIHSTNRPENPQFRRIATDGRLSEKEFALPSSTACYTMPCFHDVSGLHSRRPAANDKKGNIR